MNSHGQVEERSVENICIPFLYRQCSSARAKRPNSARSAEKKTHKNVKNSMEKKVEGKTEKGEKIKKKYERLTSSNNKSNNPEQLYK